MTLTQRWDGDVLILAPGHKVTVMEDGEELAEAVQKALEAGTRKILFDLAEVEFMDSQGVGQVVASYVSVKNKGGQLVLCRLQPRIALVLRMANLHMVLNIQDAAPDAVVWP